MERRAEVRERILLAAITCLGRAGVAGATVRAIAREAGVNIAAVSYYFGSKDALLETALERTLETAFDLSELDEAIERTGSVTAAAEAFVLDYLTNMQAYPQLAEAHLHGPLTGGELPVATSARIDRFVRGFAARVQPVLPGLAEGERLRLVAQLWSAVLFPGLLPGFFGSAGVDVADATQRAAYVRELIERFLGEQAGTAGSRP